MIMNPVFSQVFRRPMQRIFALEDQSSSVTWNAATDTYTQNIFEPSSRVTWNAATDTYTQELNK